MADELPPVPDDLQAIMEKLASQLPTLPNHDEALRRFEWILDALILRGQLPASFRTISRKIQAERGIKLRLATAEDKYTVENSEVDCGARIPLCGARCCGFEVTLSRQDLEEKKLGFNIDQPYTLPKDPRTKQCVHKQENGFCGVYEIRPAICRTYDCKNDIRIWLDFENRIPAPMPDILKPDPINEDES